MSASGRPKFVAAYDTETEGACLEACRTIARVHRDRGVPATFFITGKVMEADGKALVELLDEPELFEIGSHTYSHKMLRDHPICGPAASPEEIHEEIVRGKALIEDAFSRPCVGMRPGCCFDVGLRGRPDLVAEVADAGFSYISAQGWGPLTTVPAPLEQGYNYAEEGRPELWEFPAHGWHENVLKGHNAVPGRMLLWPPIYPEMQLPGFVKTPAEEVAVHRFFLDRAAADKLEYVSLIWHPWSLGRFDPAMKMLEGVFGLAAAAGMTFARFEDLRRERE